MEIFMPRLSPQLHTGDLSADLHMPMKKKWPSEPAASMAIP